MHAGKILLVGTVLVLAASSTAAPIRVGILKGTGTGSRYWHTSMHPGSAAIAAMLANPAGSGLNNPVIPAQGFSVTLFGPDSVQCSGNGCGPTSAQLNDFIAALDTLDAVVVMNLVDIGSRISSLVHRSRLIAYWKEKGVVSLHQSNDQFGGWSEWMLLGATRFRGHPPTHMHATLRLDDVDGASQDPDWKFLNHGLPDSARYVEEWLTFQHNGAAIRTGGYSSTMTPSDSFPPVRVTLNLDESTYEDSVNSTATMGGDHPMSWYRKFPTGGRFFYTALGHRTDTYDTVSFFRRHLYNAILWAGGYDVTTAIQARGTEAGRSFGHDTRVNFSGGTLTVSLLRSGAHTVEILALDGRSIEARRGAARGEYTFANLRSGLHLIAVTTPSGRHSGKVLVP